MSEDSATYYTPQARFVQAADRVWVVMPPLPALAAMGDTIGHVACISTDHGNEHVSLVSGVTENDIVGREMVLVPTDVLQEVETKIDALIAWIEKSSTALPSVKPDRIYTHTIVELMRMQHTLFGTAEPDPTNDY